MNAAAAVTREARRQQALLQAILAGGAPPAGLEAPAGIAAGPARGLQAYRINAQALAARALAAVHVRLHEALGADDFAAMAWAFWRHAPPQRGELGAWGEGLAAFLAEQPDMPPQLPDLARIEWALHEAERAADAELDAASLSRLADADAGRLSLRLRPGLRLLQVDAAAATLAGVDAVGPGPVPLLVWRRQWRAQALVLPDAQAEFTRRALAGETLQQALDGTLQACPGFAFGDWLQRSLGEGWLLGLTD